MHDKPPFVSVVDSWASLSASGADNYVHLLIQSSSKSSVVCLVSLVAAVHSDAWKACIIHSDT